MPKYNETLTILGTYLSKWTTTPGLDLDAEIAALQAQSLYRPLVVMDGPQAPRTTMGQSPIAQKTPPTSSPNFRSCVASVFRVIGRILRIHAGQSSSYSARQSPSPTSGFWSAFWRTQFSRTRTSISVRMKHR